jgi:hypothetical protein
VFLALIERVREGRTRLLWWLPAITVLWTNLHGGFPVGILILCSYGAGALVGQLVKLRGDCESPLPYFAAALGCLATSLINPYFYHLHVHIWQYLNDSYAMNNIIEFLGANFRNGGSGYFEAMLVLGIAAAIWFGARRRFAEVLLLAGWAHLGLLSSRNIPIFMVVAAPITAEAAVAWLKAIKDAPVARWLRQGSELVESVAGEIGPIDRLWRVHAVSAIVLVLIGLAMASPAPGRKLKPEYDTKAYPERALAQLDPGQRIFTHDEWGDYLIYRLSPNGTKVFIDGRSDFYGEKFCQEYIDVMNVKYNWEQTLARYGVDTILLPPTAALASTLKESSHWRAVYDDGLAIVFRPAIGAAGRGEQTSTSGTGGRERDHRITQLQHVISKDHGSQITGANPL